MSVGSEEHLRDPHGHDLAVPGRVPHRLKHRQQPSVGLEVGVDGGSSCRSTVSGQQVSALSGPALVENGCSGWGSEVLCVDDGAERRGEPATPSSTKCSPRSSYLVKGLVPVRLLQEQLRVSRVQDLLVL